MARFRCRACGEEDTFVYDGRHDCPRCGSIKVQLAIGIEELADDSPIFDLIESAEIEPTETDD